MEFIWKKVILRWVKQLGGSMKNIVYHNNEYEIANQEELIFKQLFMLVKDSYECMYDKYHCKIILKLEWTYNLDFPMHVSSERLPIKEGYCCILTGYIERDGEIVFYQENNEESFELFFSDYYLISRARQIAKDRRLEVQIITQKELMEILTEIYDDLEYFYKLIKNQV